jgi:hypothetical protein
MKTSPYSKKIYLITLFIFLLALSTCKKEEPLVNPDEIVIAEEVNVIPDQNWQDYFEAYDSTTHTITFSSEINSSHEIKTGDILVSSKGEGLLRKVSKIQASGNQIIVETTDATITEVIKQGIIEFESPLTTAKIESIEYHYDGISLKNENMKSSDQAKLSWDINSVLYDYDGQAATTFDQIKLVGDFNCDWKLKGKIEIGLLDGLKEVDFGFESTENLNLKVIAGLEYSFEKKVTLATVNFTPIIVTVGVVPVVFTPQLKIIAGIDGYANASITTGFEQSLSFKTGIRYLKNQGWAPYSEFDKTLGFNPPQLNMNAGAGIYLKPELSMKLYSVAGPYANLKL